MSGSRTFKRITAIALAAAFAAGAPPAAFADAAKGEQVYKTAQCAFCHKVNGSGGKKGGDLSAVGRQRDAVWLKKYLVNPKSMIPEGTMPPVKVTPDELKDLIEYLETLKAAK